MERRNKWLLRAFASAIVFSQVTALAPLNIHAEQDAAVLTAEERAAMEVWRQFKSSSSNDNGNNAAILVNTNSGTAGMKKGELSFTLKPNSSTATTRFNVGPWITDNTHYMTIGYNKSGWFYEYKGAGNNYPTISGVPVPPEAGQEMLVSVKWDNRDFTVNIGGQEARFQIPEEAFNGLSGKDTKLGFRIGSWGDETSDIMFKDFEVKDGDGNVVVEKGKDTWELQTKNHNEVFNGEIAVVSAAVTGKVLDENGQPAAGATVTVGEKTTTTGQDGTFRIEGLDAGHYTVTVSKDGYTGASAEFDVVKDDVKVADLSLSKGSATEFEGDDTLVSEKMEASISNKFPQVFGYTMKGGDVEGKKFYGQTERLTQIALNGTQQKAGTLVTPKVTFKKDSASKATYTMEVNEQGIQATITATLEVVDNTLAFNITKIDVKKGHVFTVDIPNHSLVSVKGNQTDANLAGANMSTNTTRSGDTFTPINSLNDAKTGYMYAFVSNDDLSAGLWSNSENNVNADWQRVTADTRTVNDVKETGLRSTFWTYQKDENHRKEDKPYEMPAAKIVITGDENADNQVDWQDGAIAYRTIMNNPVGSEEVPDNVAQRIAMNFNSHAQNPFLMTYDNAQKVYLNTDGLGQSIILKGYGSEGHDSGHLNYADIGRRIGGVEEMKKLLAQGKEIGARFGIHVNASETYPESKYFEEDRLRKNPDGSLAYGWNWLDQGVNIDADYDLMHGREQRFVDLYNKLGGKDNDLDFIYVDVWGNGQSGDNGTWASRQLAKEITQTCGWRLASEWGHANEYDSTFQHWAADLTYGGAANKGINSEITRFIRNHQKDSWVGDYPSYGGAAVNPLLGGYDMKDFEGWQGRNDYKGYITNLFDDDLSTKFLQHYKVMKWEDGAPTVVNGAQWTPEMKITLQDDARQNTVVVERKSGNGADPAYNLRTMTFNGRTIMDGEKYLIPWFWDANGNDLKDADQKLYHWNQQGGTSTWQLPEGWEGAKLYELTETGNVECSNLATIQNGQITINAKASVPYVLHKANAGEGITASNLTWSKGSHLIDTGFNSNSLDQWKITGEGARIMTSAANNMMLEVGNDTAEVTLTQDITDLEPGKGYAAYVGVDNRSDAKAYIEVTVDGKKISNYTERSIAKNYLKSYAHNTNNATIQDGGSYFQNMYVFFTAPEAGKKVTLTLRREAGAGKTYFDDPRIVNNMFPKSGEGTGTQKENEFDPFVNEDKLVQTFEAVPQGLFPFVIGNVENVEDNRTHLSEKHAPYTQAGWRNVKKLDDVLEGNWSVKTNGLSQRGRVVYQTIPQNFRFKAGVTYNVSFDYEMGSEDTYRFIVGNGESTGANFDQYQLKATDTNNAKKQTARFRVTGQPGDKTWIGIYSTTNPANTQGAGGKEADFGGYKDFILDNLTIQKANAQTTELEALIEKNSSLHEVNYTAATWKTFTAAMNKAKKTLENFDVTQAEVDKMVKELTDAVNGLKAVAITVSGHVETADHQALKGIDITATTGKDSVTIKTDAQGNYVLPGVKFGKVTVKADSKIYKTVTQNITADEKHQEVTVNFTLAPEKTTVTGTVTAVGEPVEGATVTFGGYTATTDAKGKYTVTDVTTNVYDATASKDGVYDPSTKKVTISKGKTNTLNFVLPPLTRDEADYQNNYDNVTKAPWEDLAGNTASTSISMDNGAAKISFPGGHTNVYEINAPEFKNGCVEMDITSDQDGIRLGILLRAKDMNNRVYVGVGDAKNQYFTEHWGKGGNAWSNMSNGPAFNAGEKMHLKAEIREKTITLWVNGQKVLSNTMNAVPMEAGHIGINTRNNHTIHVDNVKVTSYDAPKGDSVNVAGRVVNGDSAALAGVTVQLKSGNKVVKETTTDAQGVYFFKNVAFGQYKISASKDNLSKEVAVEAKASKDYITADRIVLGEPTTKPTAKPTVEPTVEPTAEPTVKPTAEPTATPTAKPSTEPAPETSDKPTVKPTTEPGKDAVTVTYTIGEKSVKVDVDDASTLMKKVLPEKLDLKANQVFKGWFTEPNGKGTKIDLEKPVSAYVNTKVRAIQGEVNVYAYIVDAATGNASNDKRPATGDTRSAMPWAFVLAGALAAGFVIKKH